MPKVTKIINALKAQPALVTEALAAIKLHGYAGGVAVLSYRLPLALQASSGQMAAALYRIRNPTSRVEDYFYFSLNSGQRRERTSLDGHTTGTWCGNYRRTKSTIEREDSATKELESDSAALLQALCDNRRIA